MGLLSLGTPLDWHESKKHNEHVRDNGIEQLINIFRQHSARSKDHFYWGDEVEYMLVDIDSSRKTARLAIDKDSILDDLNDPAKPEISGKAISNNVSFHPEYGRYMIEATPLRPYDGNSLEDYVYVEENMIKRREVSQSELPANIVPLTLTTYPRMGCGDFTSPKAKPIGPASQSLFLPDEIINRHVRFPTLTANIRKRRGHKVAINLPIYPDTNTKLIDDSIPKRDLFPSDEEPFIGASQPGHVYMDSMGFGMGSSCLQITVQPSDIHQARYLYDTLAPLTPILMAVSAAAPIFKGFLVNQDVRWNVISGAVDDRTFLERDIKPYKGADFFGGLDVTHEVKDHFESLGGGPGVNGDRIINEYGDTTIKTLDGKPVQKVPKSRYESIDTYLGDQGYHDEPYFDKSYNDIYSPVNKKVYDKLTSTKLFDPLLAHHFAHLFIRDPLVIFSERVNQDNTLENDHFENLQSTNWQTLRFKPPALYQEGEQLSEKPGWRVEFRPLEIQLTDFENAAYSVFITLVSKAILKFNPDFYTPISKVDKNMKTAHGVDASTDSRFWFRNPSRWRLNNEDFKGYDLTWFDRFVNDGNDLFDDNGVYLNGYVEVNNDVVENGTDVSDTCNDVKLSASELIDGSDSFPGLIKLVVKLIATELIPSNWQNKSHHCKSRQFAKELELLRNYLKLISFRASGKIPTIARFLRDFVLRHPDYKQDSKVSDRINYDLVQASVAITNLDFKHHSDLLEEYFGEEIAGFLSARSAAGIA
ncbi:uncharacterized protein CXQ87_000067 [Candidozyma duobushaemuli]|uniref:Glutamate--cysteine ligase n=2 Tax=Candidozyma TaxID=3303203 RepID=A0ABX8I1X5_9ASCO|nr:uncharacterized protein CXQ87_000067 [[Candida] duobushaemulonis]PVH17186.1 hypothetical protein CXQ87_000067 [[Candida] duobushaemulonis]QWU85848.1 hypothetical protein CA3LBN_000066 [[Candida] haemuloni]